MPRRCFVDVAPVPISPNDSCVTVGREHGFSFHAHAHETDGPSDAYSIDLFLKYEYIYPHCIWSRLLLITGIKRTALVLPLLLFTSSAWALPSQILIAGADAACPAPSAVALRLQQLLPKTEIGIGIGIGEAADSATVRLIDLGHSYRVSAAGQTRELVDESRSCKERARVAAVFAALMLHPPVVVPPSPPIAPPPQLTLPAPPALPTRRSRLFADLEFGGLFDSAPRASSSLFSGGAEVRATIGGKIAGVALGIGGLSSTSLALPTGHAQLTRIPIDLSLRLSLRRARFDFAGDLGLAATVLLADGVDITSTQRAIHLDLGLRLGALVRLWVHPRIAPYLALHATISPRPENLQIEPIGTVETLPIAWIGISAGLSVKLH